MLLTQQFNKESIRGLFIKRCNQKFTDFRHVFTNLLYSKSQLTGKLKKKKVLQKVKLIQKYAEIAAKTTSQFFINSPHTICKEDRSAILEEELQRIKKEKQQYRYN